MPARKIAAWFNLVLQAQQQWRPNLEGCHHKKLPKNFALAVQEE